MVELRAVEAAFPFYGTLELADGQTLLRTTCCADRGALVRPELLAQLGMRVGRRLLIGGQPFTIRGVIARSRAGASAHSVSARASSSTAPTSRQTGLLGFGSRASYQLLFKVREDGVDRSTSRLRRTCATASRPLGRTRRSRTTSATTSAAPRTTSAWSAS